MWEFIIDTICLLLSHDIASLSHNNNNNIDVHKLLIGDK